MILHWQERAACRGAEPNIFFPKGITEKRYDVAKTFCVKCPVKKECLLLVIELEPFEDRWGIFGGFTPKERIQERKRRRGAP